MLLRCVARGGLLRGFFERDIEKRIDFAGGKSRCFNVTQTAKEGERFGGGGERVPQNGLWQFFRRGSQIAGG